MSPDFSDRLLTRDS